MSLVFKIQVVYLIMQYFNSYKVSWITQKKILTECKKMRCATTQCQTLQSNPKGYKLHSQELGWKESQQRNDLQFKMEILRQKIYEFPTILENRFQTVLLFTTNFALPLYSPQNFGMLLFFIDSRNRFQKHVLNCKYFGKRQ